MQFGPIVAAACKCSGRAALGATFAPLTAPQTVKPCTICFGTAPALRVAIGSNTRDAQPASLCFASAAGINSPHSGLQCNTIQGLTPTLVLKPRVWLTGSGAGDLFVPSCCQEFEPALHQASHMTSTALEACMVWFGWPWQHRFRSPESGLHRQAIATRRFKCDQISPDISASSCKQQ